jgi:putative acetyltransferase
MNLMQSEYLLFSRIMKSIQLKRTNSDDPDFKTLVAELNHDLRVRNGEIMEIYEPFNIIEENNTVVLAYLNDEPAGCGCFKKYDNSSIEVKRMFVRIKARGNGISKMILAELEKWAKELGFAASVLETGGRQAEALSLYPKAGYRLIPNYGQYVGLADSVCFKKELISDGF